MLFGTYWLLVAQFNFPFSTWPVGVPRATPPPRGFPIRSVGLKMELPVEEAIFCIHTPVFPLVKFLLSHLYKHNLNFVENSTKTDSHKTLNINITLSCDVVRHFTVKEDTSFLYKQTQCLWL